MWMVALYAEFDEHLPEPVPMPSFTPLHDWITSILPPLAAGNMAHFIAVSPPDQVLTRPVHVSQNYWIGLVQFSVDRSNSDYNFKLQVSRHMKDAVKTATVILYKVSSGQRKDKSFQWLFVVKVTTAIVLWRDDWETRMASSPRRSYATYPKCSPPEVWTSAERKLKEN